MQLSDESIDKCILILMISNNLIKILKLTDVHFLMETINCWQLFGVADNIYGVDITA